MNILAHGFPEMSGKFQENLVTVIIPTHNRASLLREAIHSVYNQTYRPIELIVVDDGSEDQTEQVVSEWIEKNNGNEEFSIQYFHQVNMGAPTARNKGLIESSGEYIQYMDSDDLLHPQKLELHVAALKRYPDLSFVWSDRLLFNQYSEIPDIKYSPDVILSDVKNYFVNVSNDLLVISGNVWSGLYRRELCRMAGPWREELIRWQDLEYNIRLSAINQPKCIYIHSILYFMRNHSMGRIQDYSRQEKGVIGGLQSLKAIEEVIKHTDNKNYSFGKKIAKFYLGLAKIAMRLGNNALVTESLNGAKRQSVYAAFSFKLKLIDSIYRCFGSKVCCSVLDWNFYVMSLLKRS